MVHFSKRELRRVMKSTPKKNILNNTENIIKDTGSFMLIEFIVS